MTEEEFDALMEQAQALQYDENGVDLSHLRENLKRTPAQRLARLESYLRDMVPLRKRMQERQKVQRHA